MNIDPKIQVTSDGQPERVQGPRSAERPDSNGTSRPTLAPASGASGEDTVSLSSTHQEAQSLTSSLASVPEVRSQLVNSFREQIQQGQYQPSSQKVADAIAQEHGKVNLRV
jgi:flagellar biosynthesis anti-sigma factor FlgM